MNCESSTSKEVIACLQSKQAEEVANFNKKTKVKMFKILSKGSNWETILNQDEGLGAFPIDVFSPRIDIERESPFLPAHPKELIKEKRFNAVPYISGLNEHEGIIFVACKKN